MQLAFAISILANNGIMFRPHIVRHIQDSQTNELTSIEVEPVATMPLKPENVALVRDAMVDVTRPGGTAALPGRARRTRSPGRPARRRWSR